jgi:hypothetical protein
MSAWQALSRLRYVVLHQTGGTPWEAPEEVIARQGHVYHVLVYPDGRVLWIAPPSKLLYHVDGGSTGTLSVGIIGDSDVPPPVQAQAAHELVEYLFRQFPSLVSVRAHRECDERSGCPGPEWTAWVQRERERVCFSPVRRMAGRRRKRL